jgi:demethylmenaquinone methyltransferase/2-methoxy-6-polyprenyl-1,4-benzoquinol methylase
MHAPDAAEVPRRIFSPIASDYDRPAQLLGLFQYRRWHRFLIARLMPLIAESWEGRPARILDMATGTGAIALDLLRHDGVRVVGADVTRPMLLSAQARADSTKAALPLVECTAEALPFADGSFDAITFAYLLRYVGDVPATLHGLARLLRSGGMMASLDFGVPRGVAYSFWRLYVDAVLPLAGRVFSRDWRSVGEFLGSDIRSFYQSWPEPRLLQAWRDAGFSDVRSQRLSLGGGVVIWGTKS